MAKVLGKVTGELDIPRGPDGVHRITVAREWLSRGATVEFELPRNITCARCEGGGCDVCERSGAVSTRPRKEEPESIQITLPETHTDDGPPSSSQRSVVVRIPDRGGMPESDSDLPRGNLLVSVRFGTVEEANAEHVSLSIPPPPVAAPIEPAAAPEEAPPIPWMLVLALVALLAIISWFMSQ